LKKNGVQYLIFLRNSGRFQDSGVLKLACVVYCFSGSGRKNSMGTSFSPEQTQKGKSKADKVDAFLERSRRNQARTEKNYREQSLRIHPWVCARCGREFTNRNVHELTVHHKDHDHQNNPSDGSNWENLCVYCHEDIHSREILAGQIDTDGDSLTRSDSGDSEGMVSLADKLKAALEKK